MRSCRNSRLATRAAILTLALLLGAPSLPAGQLLIRGATLHPISAPSGVADLLIADGRIAAIGPSLSAEDAEVVDAGGKQVYPGLIAAVSLLGLTEIEALRASRDYAEVGDVNANARALIAIHADSELFPVARDGGVLHAHVVPMNPQGLFVGRSSLVRTSGWNFEQMLLAEDVGVHLVWPSTLFPPWLPAPMRAEAEKAAAQKVATLKATLDEARRYRLALEAGNVATPDLRLAALVPMLAGRQKLFIHAEDDASIRAVLDFTASEGLAFTLVGGQDAWRVAGELAARRIDVILSSRHSLPLRRHEGHDVVYRSPAILHQAGVRFALAGEASSMGAALEKNLGPVAAAPVPYGLPEAVALRAITLDAAAILGVDDRIGSLEVGKEATLFIADGSPLEITTRVERLYVQGAEVPTGSRHTRLYERYRTRLPE